MGLRVGFQSYHHSCGLFPPIQLFKFEKNMNFNHGLQGVSEGVLEPTPLLVICDGGRCIGASPIYIS